MDLSEQERPKSESALRLGATCQSRLSCFSAVPTPGGDYIAMGDVVIFVVSMDKIVADKITEGRIYSSAYGEFHHNDMVGKPYGAKLFSKTKTGFIFALRFSPSLWTRSMERRTQILFIPDISIILTRSNIQPGSRVCEAGIGSGSLTHHLLHRIYPGGRLFCCDIDESRARLAHEDLLAHYSSPSFSEHLPNGLVELVDISHRDVSVHGFQETAVEIDFVFLDMPCPEKVVPHLQRSLRVGALCAIFVPCLEQVHTAVQALCTHGFGAFETIKSFSITYEAFSRSLPVPPLRKLTKNSKNDSTDGSQQKRGGVRAHVTADVVDTVKFSGLTPTKFMRTHTGFLLFANYFG
ncbi:tRNA (adenine57-N1/adenine58-N1)-methyltransferase catalytic subunit [Giardia duodenalis]|uniref:tRNA (adenine(58)-N(1))-methyltransferase n=1 Tax=Giardia intestinalis (strain ATCC 50803 / WB clone C6) TaxID=184922 RepID=A8BWP1_GIAIC|nr:tRNA (adenine57-N1/adenine58-N1)-methyltransferase catalytic subunit [Giardia intestinalis]KAE8304079.1 tRNA (adenine57-N1/adenine58-N1)-methyltransferase catalytic subunit [Giardia intestinalis]|eukprot:XP_001704449.1 tRNA methyltransferase subunit, putative [Giardia lamblia ATCC 50803]